MNQDDIKRAMIKAAIKKFFRDTDLNSNIALRELVTTGNRFSNGGVQKEFFYYVQKILSDDHSAYYILQEELLRLVNHNTIETFGINIGYNSWTLGVQKIRDLENIFNCHIPWTIVLDIAFNSTDFNNKLSITNIENIISQGRSLGIYTYIMFMDENSNIDDSLYFLYRNFPDCAFILFISPIMCDKEFARKISSIENVMISVDYGKPDWNTAIELLKEKKCLFGVHYFYSDDTGSKILTGEKFDEAVENSCNFVYFIRDNLCSNTTEESVSKYISELRLDTKYPVIAFNLFSEIDDVDQIVSKKPCILGIHLNGDIFILNNKKTDFNILKDSLIHILMGQAP